MNIGIVSGYFNPIHIGHLRMLEDAKRNYDKVFVIVNNDRQQIMKKGKIIIDQIERAVIVGNYTTLVDDLIISIDNDETVCESIRFYAELYPEHTFTFLNGGDRESMKDIPESKVCKKYNIKMKFGCGGNKIQSSSIINKIRGLE